MGARKFSGTKEELEKYFIDQHLPAREVCKKFGVKKSCILYWAKRLDIKIPSCGGRNIKDLTGQRFGRLLVVSKTKYLPGRGEANWLCQCDCGNTSTVVGKSLRNGYTKSCGCIRFEKCYKGYRSLSGDQWHRIIKGAKIRNLEFSIEIKDAWKQYEKQNQRCALTGIEIKLVSNYSTNRKDNTASLDRIDNNIGYTIDNIQWVHKIINRMRRHHKVSDFVYWCRKVAEYNAKPFN